MNNERLNVLFKKQVEQRISPEEHSELHHLMADPVNGEQVEQLLRQEWTNFTPGDKILSSSDSTSIFSKLIHKITFAQSEPAPERRSRFVLWRAAAAVLLVIAGAVAIYFAIDKGEAIENVGAKMNHVSTQPGSKTKLQLSDGTQVWLHSNSRLDYNPETFGKANREVTLHGEAYFDVVKNSGVPFVIHTGQINITVKGTAFNVKAYPTDRAIETTLIRGLIEITTVQDPDRKILLKPNEKISIPVVNLAQEEKKIVQDTTRSLFSITRLKQTEQAPPEVSWIQDQLVFDDEPLTSLAPKMASWYNVDIQFEDEEVKKKRFSGTIERETLKETLEAMQVSFPFEYNISGDVLYIRSKK